jgi:hypothetical protein
MYALPFPSVAKRVAQCVKTPIYPLNLLSQSAMIRFHLKCDQDHQFESWFQSGAAFDKLVAAKMVNCTACGSADVSKMIMAPAVSTSNSIAVPKQTDPELAALKKKVEAHSEYVGGDFATEAREIHEGTKPERPIYGEANLQEAKKLVDDGIPVMPLPFVPRKKVN